MEAARKAPSLRSRTRPPQSWRFGHPSDACHLPSPAPSAHSLQEADRDSVRLVPIRPTHVPRVPSLYLLALRRTPGFSENPQETQRIRQRPRRTLSAGDQPPGGSKQALSRQSCTCGAGHHQGSTNSRAKTSAMTRGVWVLSGELHSCPWGSTPESRSTRDESGMDRVVAHAGGLARLAGVADPALVRRRLAEGA